MLTLYHWKPVATSLRVLIALHEKGLEFESCYVDLFAQAQFKDAFRAINPFAQVPVLVCDGQPLFESVVINEFIEELSDAHPLVPRGANHWYQQQCWTKYLDYNMTNSVATLGWWTRSRAQLGSGPLQSLLAAVDDIPVPERREVWRAALGEAPSPEAIETSERKLALAIERMEVALQQHDFLLGEEYSLVDVAAYPMTRPLPELLPESCSQSRSPAVMAWLQRIAERPAVKAALATPVPEDGMPGYAPGPEHSRWG